MFRSSTITRELVLSLAKVTLKHLCPYRLCGGVAACLGVARVLCDDGRRPKHVGAIFVNSSVNFKHFQV
jgi:hypothetical protein